MTATPIPAALFSHGGAPGLERVTGGARRIDPAVDFTVKGGSALPAETTATWTGTLSAPATGTYWLSLQALGADARLFIDGKVVAVTGAYAGDVHGDVLQPAQDDVLPTIDGLDNVRRPVALTTGAHTIEVRIAPDTSHAPAQVRLAWYTPEQRRRDFAEAVEAARKAKVAVVFAWARRAPAFVLPGDQDRLIAAVAAVNPNTVVVLNTSQPVALPWADSVKAILEMWWPGDEGGWATAKLLLGRADPSGRLPVTWARALQDYPAGDPAHPERSGAGVDGRTTFSEGLDVGYRGFERRGVAPLFPFGHGLGYTRFDYSVLKVAPAPDGGLRVSVRVRNTGRVGGAETPQVYLGPPASVQDGVAFASDKLVAFDRVALPAGGTRTVRFRVPLRQLQYWSSSRRIWVTAIGKREVRVGASSRDIRLRAIVPT